MTEERERRVVFGEVADAYESARPGYPDELVADTLEFARLDGAPVIEIGAGTGKASLAFAAKGVPLTCVEPDPRMAAVLGERLAGSGDTTVFHGGFEDWSGPDGQFGLLISATAWHWVDPKIRWTKAAQVLRPGGAIALFWHAFRITDPTVFDVLAAAHDRYGLGNLVFDAESAPQPYDNDLSEAWPMAEMGADERYVDVTARRYAIRRSFSDKRFIDLMESVSRYRILPETQRTALFREVAAIVAGLGGTVDVTTQTRLFLARTRA